jgi:hypothetical protein
VKWITHQLNIDTPAAVTLLQLAAFLAPEPIPLHLFRDHGEVLAGACHEDRVSRWWTRIDLLDGKSERTPRGTESRHGSTRR